MDAAKECQYCDKVFSTVPNLLKHIRNVHKAQTNAEKSEINFNCEVCGKGFASKSGFNRHRANQHEIEHCDECDADFKSRKELYVHKRQHHNDGTDQQSDEENDNPHKKRVSCNKCGALFTSNSTLNRHKRQKHEEEAVNRGDGNMTCPECGGNFHSFLELDNHLDRVHQKQLIYHTMNFETMRDFENWKRDTEERQCSNFYSRNKRENVRYYRCNRSGDSKKENGRQQWAPMMKTAHTCPARIILRKEENGYKAEFQEVHVGHKMSPKEESMTLAGNHMSNIAASHHKSLEIKQENITKLDDNKWQVQSVTEGRGPYIVQLDNDASCDGCPLTCPACKICIHQYQCDCVDYNLKGNFCKHIHACVREKIEILPETSNEVNAHIFEEECKTVAACNYSEPVHVSQVDKREKLKSFLDSIYALSKDVEDDDLDSVLKGAEHLMTHTQSLASASQQSLSSKQQLSPAEERGFLLQDFLELKLFVH